MKTKLLLIAGFMITMGLTSTAQKVVLESGDVTSLKGQKKLLLEYDFKSADMGKEGSETDYLNKKKADLNTKEAGKGDKFVENWNNAKKERYPSKFEELFNKIMDGKMVANTTATDAKYKMTVKTLTIYPGFNVGIMKYPAYCSYEFTIVEIAHADKVLAKMTLSNVAGSQMMGFDYEPSQRLQESYAKAGKIMAKYIDDKAN